MENLQIRTATVTGLYDLTLLEEMDDNEYLKELLAILLMEMPKDMGEMKEALQARKTDIICKKAHKLKSSAGVIQAENLKALLENIEVLGKNGETGIDLICLVENAAEEYNRIEKALRSYVDGLK